MLRAWKQENKDKPRSCPTSLLLYSVMVSWRPVPAGLRWCPHVYKHRVDCRSLATHVWHAPASCISWLPGPGSALKRGLPVWVGEAPGEPRATEAGGPLPSYSEHFGPGGGGPGLKPSSVIYQLCDRSTVTAHVCTRTHTRCPVKGQVATVMRHKREFSPVLSSKSLILVKSTKSLHTTFFTINVRVMGLFVCAWTHKIHESSRQQSSVS